MNKKGHKQRSNRKKDQLKRRRRPELPSTMKSQITGRMADQLNSIVELIDDRDFERAEQRLLHLDQKGSYVEVVELFVSLYQEMGDQEKLAAAAARWMKMAPTSAEAQLIFAQASMFSGLVCGPLLIYQEFVESHPNHRYVDKAKAAIEILVPEAERRIKSAGLESGDRVRLMAMHEAAVAHLGKGDFQQCAVLCNMLCEEAPEFVSPYNNLALATFYCGNLDEATAIAEHTRARFPDNGFVAASLAKLYFTAARIDEAQGIADELVANPPTESVDALIATLETLAFLGRDREIVQVCEKTRDVEMVDPQRRAPWLHYFAYAQCRLGDPKAARENWKAALKAMPEHPDAQHNLHPTGEQRDHVPWADPVAKWFPGGLLQQHAENRNVFTPASQLNLISVLLDRGSPDGREIGLQIALIDLSPATMEVLRAFAFSKRGPLELRTRALAALQKKGLVGTGPHNIFSNGEFRDVELVTMEIHQEAVLHPNLKFRSLMEEGGLAMNSQNYDVAERCFSQAMKLEPNDPKANYNLATVWLMRDGKAGQRKSRERIERLHERFPDYTFAGIAMAQFAAMDGDVKRANQLLQPFFAMPRMHFSEAKALYVCKVQVAIQEKDFDAAQKTLLMLRQICDSDDVSVAQLQRKLDASKTGRYAGA